MELRTCCEQRLHNSSAAFGVIQEALAGCCSWETSDINVVLHAEGYAVQCAPQLLRQSLQLPAESYLQLLLTFHPAFVLHIRDIRASMQTYEVLHSRTSSQQADACSPAASQRQNLGDRQGEVKAHAIALVLSGRAPCTSQQIILG